MNERDRMDAGLIYDPGDPAILEEQSRYVERLYEFNASRPREQARRIALLREMLGAMGEGCWI